MAPIIFFVEGNIGSGKSTFLKNIKIAFDGNSRVQFLQEPVDIWKSTKDVDGSNILEHFYSDMERFCYTFQSFAFISRIKQLDMIDQNADYVFIERSVHCDRNVFASACHDSNMMKDIEWQIYNTWFEWMEQKYIHIFNSARYIYLQCSAATAYERIGTRGRPEETGIDIKYLETLNAKHNEWLVPNSKTIILDAEQNFLDSDILKKSLDTVIMTTNKSQYQHTDWKSLADKAAIAANPTASNTDQRLI
jgi:deoxyadenosine/deoxycytidine kinase